MTPTLLAFIVFALLGVTTEVCFTAIQELVTKRSKRGHHRWRLQGHSYIWMLPIYGSIAFLFPLLQEYVFALPLILRLVAYAIAIWVVEFITGWILEKLTGKCPWEYTSRLAIKGYIRLDYLPVWMAFGFIIEQVFALLHQLRW